MEKIYSIYVDCYNFVNVLCNGERVYDASFYKLEYAMKWIKENTSYPLDEVKVKKSIPADILKQMNHWGKTYEEVINMNAKARSAKISMAYESEHFSMPDFAKY